MKVSPAKENILKKIRKALSHSTPLPFPQSEGNSSVFKAPEDELDIVFATEFTKLLGKFSFCRDVEEMKDQLTALCQAKGWDKIYFNDEDHALMEILRSSPVYPNHTDDLAGCDASVTFCECLIARTGSIVMSAAQKSGRTVSVYAPVHICIAFTSQVVYDVKDGLQLIREKYKAGLPSLITFATGPSRTADIEKTLVVGVHGPKEVYLFLVDKAS